MGGNLIPNSRRVDSKDALDLTTAIRTRGSMFKTLEVIPWRFDKHDHGDIDLIVTLKDLPADIYKEGQIPEWGLQAIEQLGGFDASMNHNVLTLGIEDVQIDIQAYNSDEEARCALEFCSYDPIGNLIGILLKKTPLRWGNTGPRVQVKENGQRIGLIPLGQSIKPVLKFAGLEQTQWEKGFGSLKDMADFVSESWLFDPKEYEIKNVKGEEKVRVNKRDSFRTVLEELKTHKEQWTQVEENQVLPWLEATFPRILGKMKKMQDAHKEKTTKGRKLTGELASAWTGLKGEELQKAIHSFRLKFGDKKEYDDWITNHSGKAIRKAFVAHCEPKELEPT